MIVNPFRGITTNLLMVGVAADAPGSPEPLVAPDTV